MSLNHAFRYSKRIVAGLFLLLIVGWIVLWAYLSTHKQTIRNRIEDDFRKKTNATLSIAQLDISFFHTFPFISLELSKVIIRDSLWRSHRHDLLNVEKIYAQINPLKALMGKSPFTRVLVENGELYQYTDSAGYSNINIFPKRESSGRSGSEEYPDISGNHIKFIVEKKLHGKVFDFDIMHFKSSLKRLDNVLLIDATVDAQIHQLLFKPANGGFLHETSVRGNCSAQFDLKSKILRFDNIGLDIGEHPYRLSGKFFTGLNPAPFVLTFATRKIAYQAAEDLLSDNIRKALARYNLDRPLDLTASLNGTDPLLTTPIIQLRLNTSGPTTVTTPVEIFTGCSFTAQFFNRVDSTQAPGDANSTLRFADFSGHTEDIPLQADTIVFTNLLHPALRCNLRSAFGLKSLNNIFGSRSIDFEAGNASMDIVFNGPIETGDTVNADIRGYVRFDSAYIRYWPKNFLLADCTGNLQFVNKDVLIEQLDGRVGSTQIKMSGGIKSLMALIDKSPGKLVLNWNIFSPRLNLHDFKSFMQKNQNPPTRKDRKKFFTKEVYQIDSLLSNCDVNLHILANELSYKKFEATNIRAVLGLKNNTITLDSVRLSNSGGAFEFGGVVKNSGISNSMSLHAVIEGVDVDKMFSAFQDFGQDAITGQNIKGKFKADVNISAQINYQQEIQPGSMEGNVEFDLRDGELINCAPVENVAKKVFKDRSFSDIRFAELKDRFDIKGSSVKINRMEIESTAITLYVEGIYDTQKGTDMSIQVPLSNLKSRKDDALPINKGLGGGTGISVRLRAKTGDDGKIKITWDPFKKAVKNMRKT